jgi:hypothetical protein
MYQSQSHSELQEQRSIKAAESKTRKMIGGFEGCFITERRIGGFGGRFITEKVIGGFGGCFITEKMIGGF